MHWCSFMYLALLKTVSASVRNIVPVGTTPDPNIVRQEGKLSIPCPKSHPYPYMQHKRCCSTPWKLRGGNPQADDCDGSFLMGHENCCPEALSATSVACSDKDDRQRCRQYEGGSRILISMYGWGDAFNTRLAMLDLDKKCSRVLNIDYPMVSGQMSYWTMFHHESKVYACGGRLCTPPNTCTTLDSVADCSRLDYEGGTFEWKTITSMAHRRHRPATLTFNKGLSSEGTLISGGWRFPSGGGPVEMEILTGEDSITGSGFVPPIRIWLFGCVQQVAQDLLLLAAGTLKGGGPGNLHPNYYLYNITSNEWTGPRLIHQDYMPDYAESPGRYTQCILDTMGRVILVINYEEKSTWLYEPKLDTWKPITAEWDTALTCKPFQVTIAKGKVMALGKCGSSEPLRLYELSPTTRPGYEGFYWRPHSQVIADYEITETDYGFEQPITIHEDEYPTLQC